MRIGIMQPYFFPYIGYFQLINAVETFILYDDVNYIKSGWINRNRILLNSKDHLITIPLKKASSFKKINEIETGNNKEKEKILKTIKQAYSKATNFHEVFPMIESLVLYKESNLAIYLENSIKILCEKIGIKTEILVSSQIDKNSALTAQDKIIATCKQCKATQYINAVGGQTLYDKDVFHKNNLKLNFIKTDSFNYGQFNNDFVPNLSIIDLLMFNKASDVNVMLNQYKLI